jgi:glutathione synthase/RimK-type ligase-like ATP-grasp enzyme
MKKIGVLFGQERSFPMAFIERVNSKGIENITAEPVRIDKAIQGEKTGYAVIIDRISQDVPFYRTWLKNAALTGTAVINNPFWWSADDKFFNNCLMSQIGVPVPKTAILPSYQMPNDTTSESFSNLAYPLDWDNIFSYVGFPAYMKPYAGGGWRNVYRLSSKEEFYQKHSETDQLVMLLQEEIVFEEYYRCYCIGGKYVHIMPYDPRSPHSQRYKANFTPSQERLKQMEDIVLQINRYLGYDFNTVELAVRDGIPYAIDFGNPAPDAERTSVGEDNFEWVVETAANYAIERTLAQKEGQTNLTWGEFVRNSVGSVVNLETVVSTPAKSTEPKPKGRKKKAQ